jgi:hypothetical protein
MTIADETVANFTILGRRLSEQDLPAVRRRAWRLQMLGMSPRA